jgi:hypothetical protein
MKKILSFGILILVSIAFLGINVFAQRDKIVFPVNPNANRPETNIGNGSGLGLAPTVGGTGATSALIDHGGPVINTPTIYIIWYGNWNQTNGSDTAAGQQLIRDWASSISGTPYYVLNASYSTTKLVSGNVNFTPFANETTDTGTKTRLTDNNIRSIVDSAISSGRLPYNANGVYFLITSSNVTASSGFCTQYCGWHTSGNLTRGRVRYSFVGNANRCLNACAAQSTSPNGNAGIDAAISVLSHELEEANTDPDLNAWYDSSGAENADKCAWTFGSTLTQVNGYYYNMTFGGHNWLIQRNLWKSGNSWYCMVDSTHH